MSEANLLLRLKANADQAVSEIGRVEGATARLGAGAKVAGAAAAAAVGAMAIKSIGAFADFDTGMRQVFTLMPGISADAMGRMTADVQAFAQEYGLTTETVIPALYQAISAGVPEDNLFTFLSTAAETARGGATDLETAVDGLSSAVNAYGSNVLSAEDAADVMFTGVRLGKTTIGELSAALFQVAPIAAASGVSFDQVVAALAAMTASGVPTTVAATNLRGALVELGRGGTIADLAFQKITGKTFPAFVAGGGTIGEALELMADDAEASGSSVQNSFGSVEAGMAATVLASEEGVQRLGGFMDEMAGRAGATGEAFGMMAGGVGFSFDQLRAAGEDLMLAVGESLMPIIEDLIPVIKDLLPPIADLIKPLAEALVPVVEALLPLIEDLAPLMEDLGVMIEGVVPALEGMVTALGPVIDMLGQMFNLMGYLSTAAFATGLAEGMQSQHDAVEALYDALVAGEITLNQYKIGLIAARVPAEKLAGWLEYVAENLKADTEAFEANTLAAAVQAAVVEDDAMRHAAFADASEEAAEKQEYLANAYGNVGIAAARGRENELALAAATEAQAAAAMAVWEAEQIVLNARRAAIDPVFAMIQAEQELAAAEAEVARLAALDAQGTAEYEEAVGNAISAQADFDVAAHELAGSADESALAIQTLGKELGLTEADIQFLIDTIDDYNDTGVLPKTFGLSSDLSPADIQALISMILAYNDTGILPKTFAMTVRMYGEPGIVGPGGMLGFAEGGVVSRAGLATVGEHGTETVWLPQFAQVYAHGQTPSFAAPSSVSSLTLPTATFTPAAAQTVVNVAGSVWAVDELVGEIETRLARIRARGGDSALFGGR